MYKHISIHIFIHVFIYVCMYIIYIYIYRYIYIHIYVKPRTHVYVYVWIFIYIFTEKTRLQSANTGTAGGMLWRTWRVYVYIFTNICMYMHIDIGIYIRIHMYFYINVYMYACIYMYVYIGKTRVGGASWREPRDAQKKGAKSARCYHTARRGIPHWGAHKLCRSFSRIFRSLFNLSLALKMPKVLGVATTRATRSTPYRCVQVV